MNRTTIDFIATGKKIKLLMDSNRYSVKDLADEMMVTQVSVYNWIRGTKIPSIDNLVYMADIFECGIDDLIERRVVA